MNRWDFIKLTIESRHLCIDPPSRLDYYCERLLRRELDVPFYVADEDVMLDLKIAVLMQEMGFYNSAPKNREGSYRTRRARRLVIGTPTFDNFSHFMDWAREPRSSFVNMELVEGHGT